MGKNLFTSLALASTMFAASPTEAQEKITDARVGETKAALQRVIEGLDSTKYPAAITKFKDLLLFTVDNEVTPEEHTQILAAAEILAKIDPKSAEAIQNSLLGVPTVIAEKQVSALNESPEERKTRLEKEKKVKELVQMMKNMNKAFFDKKNWATAHKKDVVEVDI